MLEREGTFFYVIEDRPPTELTGAFQKPCPRLKFTNSTLEVAISNTCSYMEKFLRGRPSLRLDPRRQGPVAR